jgi:hypothetical protein
MSTTILYKEWLPDLPELNNPGLIEATNVLPSNDGYRPFLPLDGTGGTAPAAVQGAFVANGATKGSSRQFLATTSLYYRAGGTTAGQYSTMGSLIPDDAASQFAQFENIVFAAGGNSHRLAQITMGAVTSGGGAGFVAITAAPYADVVGVVGQFVVVGSLYDDAAPITVGAIKSNYLQWSSIGAPTDWPAPGSSTAIASQAGEEPLYEEHGGVMAVHGGDQHGVVLQAKAVTRMTYIGGTAVFQFDTIDTVHGSVSRKASVKVGGLVYFVSAAGFCRTNGVNVERIGAGKVDKLWAASTATSYVSCAYDPWNELVAFGNGAKIFYFNPVTSWWTVCNQSHVILVTPGINPTQPQRLIGYDGSNVRGNFAATAGSAALTPGEGELSPGRYSHVSRVKPLVSHTTAVSMTVALGTRNSQDTAASFTAETTATARTGFSDFRSEARYHRARTTITGPFTKAIGIEVDAVESGET